MWSANGNNLHAPENALLSLFFIQRQGAEGEEFAKIGEEEEEHKVERQSYAKKREKTNTNRRERERENRLVSQSIFHD